MTTLSEVLSVVVKQASFFSETVRDDALKALAEFDKDFADSKEKVSAIWAYLTEGTPLPELPVPSVSSTPPSTSTPAATPAPSASPVAASTATDTTPAATPTVVSDADVKQGNVAPRSAAEVEARAEVAPSDEAAAGESVTEGADTSSSTVVSATPAAAPSISDEPTEQELADALALIRAARAVKPS